MKKSAIQKQIDKQNGRAKDKLREFFGGACMRCGEWSDRCTIHHGMKRSQSWYHVFTPMNWHWICDKSHVIAERQSELYLSDLNEKRPDLVKFILDTRKKRETCKKTVGNMKLIVRWMDVVVKTQSYEELLALPLWQEMFADEVRL
jgi:hypothetical protein